ncbi:hypothetical protein LUZ63_007261 [Rhynchospora breviuscula]|uniref:Uncharacterized protein n=1 Tax=Rhynchospora breviuscula TaxID=2022672 RepID=A0A9Q0CSK1_9POAL|nr:hypothetical protein LUZ63_007261 [Rhynchospora breviuscula]
MTAAAVSYALGKLDIVLKMGLKLYNVSDEIRLLRLELRMIEGFLRDAYSKRNRNEGVKQWVNEVKDVAYKIEDVIDTFLVDVEGNRRASKFGRLVKKPLKHINLVDEINTIRKTLESIARVRTDLGITNTGADSEANDQVPFRPTRLSDIDDSEVVGLDSEKHQIINHLLDVNESRRTVLSIVGIGGLGKTTLAQKVYKSTELVGKFHCYIWLSISQKFNVNNLLREILYLVEPELRDKTHPIKDDELTIELQNSLTWKRYFIVLDDVWTIDLWERLKIALPDKMNASRVLITTRFVIVAKAADSGTEPFRLSYLNEDESLNLLFKKALPHINLERSTSELDGNSSHQNNKYMLNSLVKYLNPLFGWLRPLVRYLNPLFQWLRPIFYHLSIQKTHDPTYFVQDYLTNIIDVAKQLTRKCGGLPLALIVLGGILSMKECTYSAWESVNNTLDWHDVKTKQCVQVLELSYVDLPNNLKPCFLYFASFPEDYKISTKHVMRMWMAEGFVPKDGRGTMEDRAEIFLEELVQRCLVEVIKKSWNGNCKLCSMHDLIRDMAIHEASEENIFTVFSKAEDANQLVPEIVRRATLQYTTPKFGIRSTNIRSLLFFGQCISDYSGFILLRALTIEHVDLNGQIINKGWLKGLIHLRYLGVRYCKLSDDVFEHISFSSLKNLETLDFKETELLSESLLSLWEIPTLRHVITEEAICSKSKWDHLRNLQTLKWVRLENLPKLEYNINLRTVGIHIGKRYNYESVQQGWQTLKDLLEQTENLVSLSVKVKKGGCIPFSTGGTSELPCHEKIQCLGLWGEWARNVCVLSVEMLPTNLTKLTLFRSKLEHDPMPILEMLPSLRVLRLWSHSYCGRKLTCTKRGFPSLQILELKTLPNLRHWDIQRESMPRLCKLKITTCFELVEFPELQNVPTLQDLTLCNHTRMSEEDDYKIKHILSVRKEQ